MSGAIQTSTGVGLVEDMFGADGSAWLEPLDCTP
jgi:hypothetical protein